MKTKKVVGMSKLSVFAGLATVFTLFSFWNASLKSPQSGVLGARTSKNADCRVECQKKYRDREVVSNGTVSCEGVNSDLFNNYADVKEAIRKSLVFPGSTSDYDTYIKNLNSKQARELEQKINDEYSKLKKSKNMSRDFCKLSSKNSFVNTCVTLCLSASSTPFKTPPTNGVISTPPPFRTPSTSTGNTAPTPNVFKTPATNGFTAPTPYVFKTPTTNGFTSTPAPKAPTPIKTYVPTLNTSTGKNEDDVVKPVIKNTVVKTLVPKTSIVKSVVNFVSKQMNYDKQ